MLNFIQLIHYLIKKVYFYNICIKQETFGLNFVLFYQVRKRNWLYRCNTVVSLTQFIYQTFIEYNYMPGILLGSEDRAENKIIKILCSHEIYILVRRDNMYLDLKPLG